MKTEESRTVSVHGDRGRSSARIVLGALLLIFGVGWLLDASEVVEFPSRLVVPAALIVVGVALIARARRGHNRGLLALGIVLTVLMLTIPVEVGMGSGVGERVETPMSFNDLNDEYSLGVGAFTLDLSHVDLPRGQTSVEARLGIGELLVVVPRQTDLVVDGRTGAGEIVVLGRKAAAGVSARVQDFRIQSLGNAELVLDLSVGLGPIRVSRASR